jgi:hypothetical protein
MCEELQDAQNAERMQQNAAHVIVSQLYSQHMSCTLVLTVPSMTCEA